MKMWLNHQYSSTLIFSQIALESISEHVTTKIFWGSAPTPTGNSFIKHPPLSNPGYAPESFSISATSRLLESSRIWSTSRMH